MLSWSMDVFFAKQLLFASWQNVVFAGAVFLSATALVYTRPELFLKKIFLYCFGLRDYNISANLWRLFGICLIDISGRGNKLYER